MSSNRYKWALHLIVCSIAIWIAIPIINIPNFIGYSRRLAARPSSLQNMSNTSVRLPKTQADWRKALDALLSTPNKIPSFFFAHGSPMLALPDSGSSRMPKEVLGAMGPKGHLASFLGDFGPSLLKKYNPKGIIVFSAHWETDGERLGTWVSFTGC